MNRKLPRVQVQFYFVHLATLANDFFQVQKDCEGLVCELCQCVRDSFEPKKNKNACSPHKLLFIESVAVL